MKGPVYKKSFTSYLWDLWCLISIVGIWPRFIEPKWLRLTRIKSSSPDLKVPLKIAFFSDLHWNPALSQTLRDRLENTVKTFDPDLLFFGGDFLCEGKLYDSEGLLTFLNRFSAKKGTFAILGNHDYEAPLSINEAGDYDVASRGNPFLKAFARLFDSKPVTGKVTDSAKQLKPHPELVSLLEKSPFQLLLNRTVSITNGSDKINIVGLGEYMAGQADRETGFSGYDKAAFGVVLVHNPDMIPHLVDRPGAWILSGHTHGGQINLPWIWKRLTAMENQKFKKGAVFHEGKTGYVSRGVGSTLPFRWRASPELLLLTVVPDA
jgi:predicted MPP superfamily phosphohydrolase